MDLERLQANAAMIVSLALLIGACATDGRDERGSAESSQESSTSRVFDTLRSIGNDPQIIVRSSSINYLIAETGRLSYNSENKCLELSGSKSGLVEAVPVWPKDTTVIQENGKRGVSVPKIGHVLEGDLISMVGGYEKWSSPPPYGYTVDGAVDCLDRAPKKQAFVIGVIERVKRDG